MAQRKVKLLEGEIYHIYNRGNSKNTIFHDKQDYERFLKMLYLCNGTKKFKAKDFIKINKNMFLVDRGEQLVDIFFFVLMPNHFHLVLASKRSDLKRTDNNLESNISVYMKRLAFAYSRYYNYKYGRSGSLFEGKFKAEHVSNSNYLKYLFSYVHLNPVKLIQSNWKEVGVEDFKKTNQFLNEFEQSSFKDYFNLTRKTSGIEKIVNKQEFFNKIEKGTDLNKEIFDWLKFKTIT